MSRRAVAGAYPVDFFGEIKTPERPVAPAHPRELTALQEAYERQYGKPGAVRGIRIPRLYSLIEAAEFLRRFSKDGTPNSRYIYNLIAAGRLRGTRDGGRWLVREDALLEYIEACTRRGKLRHRSSTRPV